MTEEKTEINQADILNGLIELGAFKAARAFIDFLETGATEAQTISEEEPQETREE